MSMESVRFIFRFLEGKRCSIRCEVQRVPDYGTKSRPEDDRLLGEQERISLVAGGKIAPFFWNARAVFERATWGNRTA
jgi:hypothetical protein